MRSPHLGGRRVYGGFLPNCSVLPFWSAAKRRGSGWSGPGKEDKPFMSPGRQVWAKRGCFSTSSSTKRRATSAWFGVGSATNRCLSAPWRGRGGSTSQPIPLHRTLWRRGSGHFGGVSAGARRCVRVRGGRRSRPQAGSRHGADFQSFLRAQLRSRRRVARLGQSLRGSLRVRTFQPQRGTSLFCAVHAQTCSSSRHGTGALLG